MVEKFGKKDAKKTNFDRQMEFRKKSINQFCTKSQIGSDWAGDDSLFSYRQKRKPIRPLSVWKSLSIFVGYTKIA